MKITVFTLVETDFGDNFYSDASVYPTLEKAQQVMREVYEGELKDCDIEDGDWDYDFGEMSATIRCNDGDYWMDWTIQEQEVDIEVG